ncbi:hypothetical protein [Nostoc sp.]
MRIEQSWLPSIRMRAGAPSLVAPQFRHQNCDRHRKERVRHH